MIGLFEENGPCYIDAEGSVINNPYSWNNVSNMIYIDQPTQVCNVGRREAGGGLVN